MTHRIPFSRRAVLTGVAGAAGSLALSPLSLADDAPAAGYQSKGRINQSLCQWCYGRMNVEDLCKQAVRIGYKSIELVGTEDWPRLKKHGLTMAMFSNVSIGSGWNRKEHHADLIAKTDKAIDLVAEAGFPNVICMSGNRDGQPDEEGIQNCIEGIKQVVGHAEKKKVNLCMEYLNSKVDHKDYAFDHMAYGVTVAKGIGSERFGILYDIYHAQIMEGDIIRTIRDNHQYIRHYHTGGNPGRNEIDDTQELNYTAIMKAIAQTGYKGYVGQEFIPKGDPVKAMQQAFRICDV
jgi:hydroxypyruvate isomerase